MGGLIMARYVDTALSEGEPVLYDARVHWAIFLEPFGKLWFYVAFGLFFYFILGRHTIGELIDLVNHMRLAPWLPVLTPALIGIGIFCLVVGLSFLNSVIYYFNSDFVLTDRRVMSKFGLLSRETSEQRLSKVESIHVYQSLLGRVLNYGKVTVTGTGSSATTFGPMVDPIACKRAIEKQLDVLKDRAGPE